MVFPIDLYRENVFRQNHVVSGKKVEEGSWVKYSVCKAPRGNSWAVRVVVIDPPPGKIKN